MVETSINIKTGAVGSIHPSDYRLPYVDKNPYYPLPADYPTLTTAGQKDARLAALTKQDTPLEFVAAWDLFRRLYLMPTEPGFFYHNYCPSPPFHYELVHDLGAYARNALAAPRGTAKSVVAGTEIPLFLLLTRPYYRLLLALATDKMIETRFALLIKQLTDNPFIQEDFGVLKPRRGVGIWNHHCLQLLNGSTAEGFSVTGRKRGARPDLLILDDPEYDDEGGYNAQTLRDKFETLLFKQAIPMLEEGSSIFWIGTMISRRTMLYHACISDDPRFQYWNRKIYRALEEAPDGSGKCSVLWDEKWSLKVLEVRRGEIGEAAFGSEYLNNPISGSERILKIDPIKTEYTVVDTDCLTTMPLESGSILTYYTYNREEEGWKEVQTTVKELLSTLFIFIAVDIARGLAQHHDYSCSTVMGFDKYNCLWILDMWMGRVPEAGLLNTIYRQGMRWHPKLIGIESISTQKSVVEAADSMLTELTRLTKLDTDWRPKVVPIDYHGLKGAKSKADRISSLEWRFASGKIKYPNHLSHKWPVDQLYRQTVDFTYDLAMLQFDDAIDTVAMAHFIIHGKGQITEFDIGAPTLVDLVKRGELLVGGVPLLHGMEPNKLVQTPGLMDALINNRRAPQRPSHRVTMPSRPRGDTNRRQPNKRIEGK